MKGTLFRRTWDSGPNTGLWVSFNPILPLVVAFALHLLFVGHDEPGGGFIAGLLIAGAISLQAVADPAAPNRLSEPEALIGGGLLLATIMAMAPLLFGKALLEALKYTFDLGPIGSFKLSSILLFDIGVAMVVVGLADAVMDRIRAALR